jgi:bifunctional non-homologous end joining protein LigD
VIGGWQAGEGGRTGQLGSLLVGVYEGGTLHFAGKVGIGSLVTGCAD